MKVPKTIHINGRKWAIKYVWGLKDSETKEHLDGLNDPTTRTIFIDRGCSKEDKPSVFIHELLHGIMFEYGFRQIISLDAEEILVETLENFLLKNFKMQIKK